MPRTRLIIRWRRRSGGRKRWISGRVVVGLTVTALVALTVTAVYLQASVKSRFEGRLWRLPSRVWSDLLVLSTGDYMPPDVLAARLDRAGYAAVDTPPARPGQYRRQASTLEVFLRPFATPTTREAARRLSLGFRSERLAVILDARGRPTRHAVFEPELLATLFGTRQEERDPLRVEQVPPPFLDAVLAAEDARFFTHHGLDLRGILRAAAVNLKSGRIVQGGSSITQQTVKNLYLDQQRTWWRKLREVALALVLDASYPKSRILEVYLNEVYWGQRGPVAICGARAAARFYFGRDLEHLSLAEGALLAGMIRSPGRYNPFADREVAVARRNQVLDAMERLGFVGSRQAAAARAESLQLGSGRAGYAGAPFAVDFVRSRLARLYTSRVLREEGLQVYTTLDTRLQRNAEQVLAAGLQRLESDWPSVRRQLDERRLEGAVLVTRPLSGEILALVGGRDYRQSQFNRAVQARRQPGSCFKPFVYAAGFELGALGGTSGLTPATLLADEPLSLRSGGRTWSPANYDREYRGNVTARRALEESLNVPTVRAGRQVGLEQVVRVARACGIESPLRPLPSLPLGTAEVTPLELATAYGTLAQLGRRATPWVIRAVADRDGRVLHRGEVRREEVLSPRAAYLVTDVLRGVFERGTAKTAAALGWDGSAAGKTGTTDDTRDAWFVGYTPDLLALVWVGYDDNARTGLTGASGALPVWVELMRRSAPRRQAAFERPAGIVTRRIDPESGLLAGNGCPASFEERFSAGTEPQAPCPLHEERFVPWWRRNRTVRPLDADER